MGGMIVPVIGAVFAFGLMIIVHELGHFIVAKKLKIYVEKFSVGFGSKIFGFKKGETQYSVSWIPLGGYVKLKGMNYDEPLAGTPDEFLSRKPFEKIALAAAGPLLNYISAIVIVFAISLFGIPHMVPKAGKIIKDMPAYNAGIKEGDIMLAVDGKDISSWEEMVGIVQKNPDKDLVFRIKRIKEKKETVLNIKVRPNKAMEKNMFGEVERVGKIGVYHNGEFIYEKGNILKSVNYSISYTWFITEATIKGIIKIVSGRIEPDVAGPIGIIGFAGKAAQAGIVPLFGFIVIVSIGLALFNLFPMPPLDGGLILIFLIEAVQGKPISKTMMKFLEYLGFTLIILLFLFATSQDIRRLLP